MFFDEAYVKKGAGVGIVFTSPQGNTINLSHKLSFYTTNNVTEYEALILGLEATRKMGALDITVFGDSEMVTQQINKVY